MTSILLSRWDVAERVKDRARLDAGDWHDVFLALMRFDELGVTPPAIGVQIAAPMIEYPFIVVEEMPSYAECRDARELVIALRAWLLAVRAVRFAALDKEGGNGG